MTHPTPDPLREAAQAVLDRWDSRNWKAAPTADYMRRLRAALAAAPQPAPVDREDVERLATELERQDEYAPLGHVGWEAATTLRALLNRAEAAEAETLEQARLNGMGGERELALMARAEQAERERDAARAEGYRKGQENMRSRIASPLFLRPLVDKQSAGEWYEETLAADTQMYADAILAVPLAPEGSS